MTDYNRVTAAERIVAEDTTAMSREQKKAMKAFRKAHSQFLSAHAACERKRRNFDWALVRAKTVGVNDTTLCFLIGANDAEMERLDTEARTFSSPLGVRVIDGPWGVDGRLRPQV
jgi:hypothetical protein